MSPGKRGRPPLSADPANRSINVAVRLTVRQYDALCSQARAGDVTLSAYIRDAVADRLRRERLPRRDA